MYLWEEKRYEIVFIIQPKWNDDKNEEILPLAASVSSSTALWGDLIDDFLNDSSISLMSNGTSIFFSLLFLFIKKFLLWEKFEHTKEERIV